jgi:hypothetical protein
MLGTRLFTDKGGVELLVSCVNASAAENRSLSFELRFPGFSLFSYGGGGDDDEVEYCEEIDSSESFLFTVLFPLVILTAIRALINTKYVVLVI